MNITQAQTKISEAILQLRPGIYKPKTIMSMMNVARVDVDWILSYLKSQDKIKKIDRGLYAIGLSNQSVKNEIKLNKKYSIENIQSRAKAFRDFGTLMYDYHFVEGTLAHPAFIVSDEYKNKIQADGTKIKLMKFHENLDIGYEMFLNYFKKIKINSYSFFRIFLDLINKYDLQKNVLIKYVPKSKRKLLERIYSYKDGYVG